MKLVQVISPRDNVGTALVRIAAAQPVILEAGTVVAVDDIPMGHKIALVAIAAGAPVIKYGAPIGTATAAIPAGGHVHVQNLSSARGRGDLGPHGAASA